MVFVGHVIEGVRADTDRIEAHRLPGRGWRGILDGVGAGAGLHDIGGGSMEEGGSQRDQGQQNPHQCAVHAHPLHA